MEFYKFDVNSDYLFCELNDLYLEQTTNLLNSEWPRSFTARSHSLKLSYENKKSTFQLPISLILILKDKNQVIGHASLSLIEILNLNIDNPNVYLQSLVVDKNFRKQGLGKMILNLCEKYLIEFLKNNQDYKFREIYLNTKDQQVFYSNYGYQIIEPLLFNANSKNNKFNIIVKNLFNASQQSGKLVATGSNNEKETWFKKKFI
jgi:ribosomal protein S18 acetylase RimI-like enzyme